MHVIEERYYKLHRIFLKAIGLWPYQQSYLVEIQKVLCTGILFSFLIIQSLVLVFTTQYNLTVVLRILALIFPILFVTLKYCLFAIQKDSVKELLEQMQDHWNLIVDELEIGIIEKYACTIRSLTVIVIALCHFMIFSNLILQFLPMILDVILPLNESRPLPFILITEYLINQEEYTYIIILHMGLTRTIGLITLSITTATIMMYILHACALFKVASYRIETAIDQNISTYPNAVKQYLFYRRILLAVVIHRKALKFIETFTSHFAAQYDILIIVGIMSVSINLFQFLQVRNNTDEAFLFAVIIFIHLLYMFIINYGGQEVIDHGKQLFNAIWEQPTSLITCIIYTSSKNYSYNGLWYTAPLHTQKLILFMMQKCKIDVIVTLGSIFVATLEGLATLISMTLSYFTVFYSKR